MSDNLFEILIDYCEKQNFKENDLIFPFSQDLSSYKKFFKWLSKLLNKKITPYNCRDTFITNQILKNVPIAIIAKWVDSSVQEIEKRYFDISLSDIKPF